MLMLLGAAKVYRPVVAVLDMEADGVFVERAARVQVRHVEDGVAGADDVERRIEDVLRNGHGVSSIELVIPGCAAWRRPQMRNCASGNPYSRSWLWIPGSRLLSRPGMTVLKLPISESCASRAPARR